MKCTRKLVKCPAFYWNFAAACASFIQAKTFMITMRFQCAWGWDWCPASTANASVAGSAAKRTEFAWVMPVVDSRHLHIG
jgi:hypothetical protein